MTTKDERIIELQTIALKLFNMVHETGVDNRIEANELYAGIVKNINYDTVLSVSVCKSYGSCYRPEKMQHEKECGKYCPCYKQTDS